MSLLERLGRGHLSERRIAHVWMSGVGHPHLDGCAACRERYATFEQWVDGIGDEIRADAEDTMSVERYALQQTQIARRLEMLDRPGRVIAFPKAARAVIGGHSHVRRWVTAAAAAGLLAGVGLGQFVPGLFGVPEHARRGAIVQEYAGSRAGARPQTIRPVPASFNDTDLLSDSFVDPRVKDLRAIDDMTPHVRDIVGK